MNRDEKEQLVQELRENLKASEFVAVTKNHGLTVSEVTELRTQIRELGDSSYKVAKNTLMRIALEGSEAEQLLEYFVGPTSVACSHKNPVALAKILVEFAKSHQKITLLAGFLGGKLLNDKEIEALSKLPSLPELMAQIVGFIQGAAMQLVKVLNNPAMELHRLLIAISNKEN